MRRDTASHAPRHAGSTASPFGYWEHLPPGYDPRGASAPLLVFFHGLGENGDGSPEALPRVLRHGPPRLVHEGRWPDARPFVLLSPQYHGPRCPRAEDVAAFLAYALDAYHVDRERVFLTGLSCGAIGAWSYLAEHAHDTVVSAAALVCGVGHAAWAQQGAALGRVALWAFHGTADEVVDPRGTIEPMTQLLAVDPRDRRDARLTLYDGVGHDSWTRTYDGSAGHDVYAWMLANPRDAPPSPRS